MKGQSVNGWPDRKLYLADYSQVVLYMDLEMEGSV